jgi:hypothetical protein
MFSFTYKFDQHRFNNFVFVIYRSADMSAPFGAHFMDFVRSTYTL